MLNLVGHLEGKEIPNPPASGRNDIPPIFTVNRHPDSCGHRDQNDQEVRKSSVLIA